jgi:hypothetical protein
VGDDDTWHEARLIPTSGINGGEEQERRATSALLAVMGAVREFGRTLTQPLGAPAGTVETFIEVPFDLGERTCFPDGLIRVKRGQRSWVALVEVKTGNSQLTAAQLEMYLDVARGQGFDALLTISNEIPPQAGQHPTEVDQRKLKGVALHHYSWSQVVAEAVIQKEHRGVADPDQAWILGELIRYLEHPRSGALQFEDMGSNWVPVRDAVLAGTLRPADRGTQDVVGRFDALLRYASLQLGRKLGTNVVPGLSRKEQTEPQLRTAALIQTLSASGSMSGAIRIPDAIGPIVVTVDLRAGKVTCHVDVDSPREGKATTRINWLVRQLTTAPPTTRIEAFTAYNRGPGSAELLSRVRVNSRSLVSDEQKEIRSFRIGLDQPLGLKRGKGKGTFVDAVLTAIDLFYSEVMQGMRAWTAPPPRLRAESSEEPVAEQLISTAISSQDGPEEPVVIELDPPVAAAGKSELPAPRHPSRREMRLALHLHDAEGDPPVAGWYQDPQGQPQLRWWNGDSWGTDTYGRAPSAV